MKKTGILVMVMVLALGSLGVGYAAWTDMLQINTTAQMGELDADFTGVWTTGGEFDPLNCGSVSATFNQADDTATVTFGNAYPGYQGWAIFTISNTGSIPVVVAVEKINDTSNPGDVWFPVSGNGKWFSSSPAFNLAAGASNNNFAVYFKVPLALGDGSTAELQPGELASYSATIKLNVTQANAAS